ncbi:DUF4265 domain-containing protein [Robbsia sp. KACC 23696]|uniref:DUF4265 domain-containing protein n=1 Tax=Robbsia sp. KACC 23696 TaxID=3149231 RepID=UPI00325C274B
MQKVFFTLDVVDDYPPVSVESLWSEKLPSGFFKVKNIPFYTKQASFDDEVHTVVGVDGELVFDRIAQPSMNSTVRLIIFDEAISQIKLIQDTLVQMGCAWEGLSKKFLSVNVPCETNLDNVLVFLDKASDDGWLDYEFGMIRQ